MSGKERTKRRKLFIARRRPRSYIQTPQQRLFSEAIESCGIVKGISRKDLVDKMVNCIPKFFKEHKREEGANE